MMARISFILLLFCVSHTIYGQSYYYKPQFSSILDTANGRKSLKQCSRIVPDSVSDFFVITSSQRRLLQNNFLKILSISDDVTHSVGKPRIGKGPKIKRIDSTLFQYTGVLINRKKYIYINALSYYSDSGPKLSEYENWQKEAAIMCDGGDSFWGALFDIDKKSFRQLRFNGP